MKTSLCIVLEIFCLFYSPVQVFAVQNHYGTWSAPKGHRKIDENAKLEIPWETSWRETFEEISIKLKGENMRELTINEILVGFLKMDQIVYLECHLESKPGSNDRTRQIGLFVIPINGNELEFSLKNYKENQVIMNILFISKKEIASSNDYFHSVLDVWLVENGRYTLY